MSAGLAGSSPGGRRNRWLGRTQGVTVGLSRSGQTVSLDRVSAPGLLGGVASSARPRLVGWQGVRQITSRLMSLSTRLALLTAAFALLLVLGTTEISLSLSERSRLDDLRRESVALAQSWADYLTSAAPKGDRDKLAEALADWPSHIMTSARATVYLRQGTALVFVVNSDSAPPAPAPPELGQALASRTMKVWQVTGTQPAWRVAIPLGERQPYGVLEVEVSNQTLAIWARAERRRAYAIALASAVLLASGIGWLARRWVGRPLGSLGTAMDQAREGVERAELAPVVGAEEFRRLARRFNEMRVALEARQRESESRAAMLTLEERARGLDRLALAEETASAFAHEIGTPLNTVSGHLQLLREDLRSGGPPAASERVQTVLAQVDRLATIVRNRLERGSWPVPVPRLADLVEVAERIRRFFEPALSGARVTARLQRAPGEHDGAVRARCDPALVEQILLNLLKNAIEAMPEGGTVHLVVGRDRDTAWLEIADTGPGLAPEAQSQLFHAFVTTKGAEGSGLGLAVSRRLARAMGGDLTLEQAERGTRWRLSLPAARRGTG